MNVYAKFRNFPLRINKALGIFRIGVTTRTRSSVAGVRDAFRRLKTEENRNRQPKSISKVSYSRQVSEQEYVPITVYIGLYKLYSRTAALL